MLDLVHALDRYSHARRANTSEKLYYEWADATLQLLLEPLDVDRKSGSTSQTYH